MTLNYSQLSTHHETWRVLTAILAAIAALAGSYAYAGLTPSFIGEPPASFVVDTTPAVIVDTMRSLAGSLALTMSFVLGLALVTVVLAAVVWACIQIEIRAGLRYLAVALALGAVWLVGTLLTGEPIAAIAGAVPAALVVGTIEFAAAHDPLSVRRDRTVNRRKRATLQAGFGVLTFAGVSAVAGRFRTPDSSVPFLDGGDEPPDAEQALLQQAQENEFELPDAPGLVSEIGEFYTIDINTIDPTIQSDSWSFSLTGDVGTELTIDYDELRSMESEQFYSTLRCVGEDLNDREIDTAVWTGVPMTALLDEAAPSSEYVVAHAEDGFWNTITREELERSYLVYGMNGRVLPREHGHPVRLIVPGNWGEVNVKWIDEIEITDEDVDGYWEERDWDGTGEVKTVAKLWSIDRDDDAVTVGGHAYAGREGVSTVEVSIDGGSSWTDAELSDELEETGAEFEWNDAWRQWRYTFEPRGDHEVVVRAITDDGSVQTETETGSRPDGAAGWVSRTIEA